MSKIDSLVVIKFWIYLSLTFLFCGDFLNDKFINFLFLLLLLLLFVKLSLSVASIWEKSDKMEFSLLSTWLFKTTWFYFYLSVKEAPSSEIGLLLSPMDITVDFDRFFDEYPRIDYVRLISRRLIFRVLFVNYLFLGWNNLWDFIIGIWLQHYST